MINMKEELLEVLERIGNPKIKCIYLKHSNFNYKSNVDKDFILKIGYTQDQFREFLCRIDYKYDGGDESYGGQELFGTVWFEDGSWLERAEYDGSEWWVHKFVPPIPNELK